MPALVCGKGCGGAWGSGLDDCVGEVIEIKVAQKVLGMVPIKMLLPRMINSSVFIWMSQTYCNTAANKPLKLTVFPLFFCLKEFLEGFWYQVLVLHMGWFHLSVLSPTGEYSGCVFVEEKLRRLDI